MQGIAIGLAVFVLSAIIIYAISALTMREKSFEQVMEEQRSRHESIMGSKPKGEKKPKKAKKQKGSKGKADESPQPQSESADAGIPAEHKMVQLELEPEIIEPESKPAPAPVSSESNSTTRSRKKKIKPILVNKSEKGLVKVICCNILFYVCLVGIFFIFRSLLRIQS